MMFFGIVLLCVGIMAIILFGVKQFKIGSQLASVNQVANLSHLLVRQQANLFSMLLMNNAKTERLVENLDNFAKEEFVLDAAVYARNGELLAQSTNSSDMRSLLGLDKKEENEKFLSPLPPIKFNFFPLIVVNSSSSVSQFTGSIF